MNRHEGREYERRNRTLRAMGFASYPVYLRSALWGRIRSEKLTRDPECYGCGCRAKEVHHGDYSRKTLEGKKPSALYSVCDRCHRRIEFSAGEGKVGPGRATQRLKAIRQKRLQGPAVRERRERAVLADVEKCWINRYRHLMFDDEEGVELSSAVTPPA